LGILKFFFFKLVINNLLNEKIKFKFTKIINLLKHYNKNNTYNEKRYFQFIRSGYLSSSLSCLCKSSPFFLLGLVSNADTVGNFRVAVNLANIGNYIIIPLNNFLFQWLNKYNKNIEINHFFYIYKSKLILWFFLVLISTICALIMANQIVVFLYGMQYIESIVIFKILLCGISISNAFFWIRTLCLVRGHEKFVYNITSYICILQLLLIYPISIMYNVNGIAFSLSLAWAVGPFAFFLIFWRK
jgi:O-antigen/teichoic acid export membrane protein